MAKKMMMKRKVAVKPHKETAVVKKARSGRLKKPKIFSAKETMKALNLRFCLVGQQLVFMGANGIDTMPPQPKKLRGRYAFEVRLDGKRVGVGMVLDEPVTRGYPNVNVPSQNYHVIVPAMLEIEVQIPSAKVSLKNLERLEVRLYEIVKTPKEPEIKGRTLSTAFGKSVRVVGENNGVVVRTLPAALQKRLRASVGALDKR